MNRVPYADPYLAGVALGLVLLAAFVLVGRGLGASGAFASTAAGLVGALAPDQAAASPLFQRYLLGEGPWFEWLSFELLGVLAGGGVSAWLAGRARWTLEKPAGSSVRKRVLASVGGGLFMAFGAVFARGCTSGQALSGGALLGVGGFLFLVCAFASAHASAWLMRGRY